MTTTHQTITFQDDDWTYLKTTINQLVLDMIELECQMDEMRGTIKSLSRVINSTKDNDK